MTPLQRHRRHQAVTSALKVLERDAQKFAAVQVAIHDRKQKYTLEDYSPGTEDRLRQVIDLFEISAEEYVGLVTDLDSQKAYETLLFELGRRTYDAFTNLDSDYFIGGQRPREIDSSINHWINEGYRRLASFGGDKSSTLHAADRAAEAPPSPADVRKAFVNPILLEKGMSPSRWANLAGVDPSVVYDYLSGKSDPRPDNRKVLAEVLGLKPSELPE